jgi:hypothetical protein
MIDTNAVGPSTRGGGRWSNFSISGNEMSTCGSAARAAARDQGRQAVQGLRPEHDVDIRRARDDRGALLARHAAADADHEVGVVTLELLDAP